MAMLKVDALQQGRHRLVTALLETGTGLTVTLRAVSAVSNWGKLGQWQRPLFAKKVQCHHARWEACSYLRPADLPVVKL